MSPIKALFTLVTLIAVPLLGYYVTGEWWGALAGFLGWLFASGIYAQRGSFAAAKNSHHSGGGGKKGNSRKTRQKKN